MVRISLAAWSATRLVAIDDIRLRAGSLDVTPFTVRVFASVRESPADPWEPVDFRIPVARAESGVWLLPPSSAIDRLVSASVTAEGVANASLPVVEPTPTDTLPPSNQAEPTPTAPPPPSPPGVVVYLSDWSNGLDGWIGTPDWSQSGGALVNDGSRESVDPWIEAPVVVEAWRSMTVEFEAEIAPGSFGSFGLVSRAGNAGWYRFGIRWEDADRGSGRPVAFIGESIRLQARRSEEEIVSSAVRLSPGFHYYRIEFEAGTATYFVDGERVGSVDEGSFMLGEFLGMWDSSTELVVRFFRVTVQ